MNGPGLADRSRALLAAVLVAALALGAAPSPRAYAAVAGGQLVVTNVLGGLSSPLGVVNAGDGSGRLFIVQQGGTVRVVKGNRLQAGTFLDISAKVNAGGERGLLGVAFHPDFPANRRLFVYYTRGDGDIVVSRLTADVGGTQAPSSSEAILFTIEHSSRSNHNGGALAFGPDGYLYIGVGDGGGGGDPDDNGQDPSTRLGKILRIDVDGSNAPGGAYGYPADNPYVGGPGDDAVFAIGLRNPWRISFDRTTGDLWIADVGQNAYEEVDRDAAPPTPGRNYGWNVMEGKHCYNASSCDQTGLTLPVAEYAHGPNDSVGCSVTGGYAYRGPSQHQLQGLYVFADYCSGRIWTMPVGGASITERRDTNLLITSFGESESGELYLVSHGGTLYRVLVPEFTDIAASTFIDDIHWIYYEGLTAGCTATTFCPTATVTREQMAIFLDRALKLPTTTTNFFDDDAGRTGQAAINRLAAAGIAAGCAVRRFCPTAAVTREQMAIFLDRALKLPTTTTNFFDDDAGRTGEASIDRVAAAGITTGCGVRRYCPADGVTREQMAGFLRRAFK